MSRRVRTASLDRLHAVMDEIARILRRKHDIGAAEFGRIVAEARRRGDRAVIASGQDLERASRIRRLLSGMPFGVVPADPSDDLLARLENVLEALRSGPRAAKLGVPRRDLFVADPRKAIGDLLDGMRRERVNIAPILDEGSVLIGVFSERTLFDAVLAGAGNATDIGRPLAALLDHCRLDAPRRVERFAFLCPEARAEDARALFACGLEDEGRIAALFVTASANPTRPIRRMITPRDVLG